MGKIWILWKIADKNMQNPMLYRFHDKIGVKLYVFMYQGPIGTSPAHMIWKPSLNMATKLILVRQKLCYGYGYIHFSAYDCDKMYYCFSSTYYRFWNSKSPNPKGLFLDLIHLQPTGYLRFRRKALPKNGFGLVQVWTYLIGAQESVLQVP